MSLVPVNKNLERMIVLQLQEITAVGRGERLLTCYTHEIPQSV